MSWAVKAWMTLLLLLLAGYGAFTLWRVSQIQAGSASPAVSSLPARPLSDFSFIERSGEQFDLEALEGKVWVASFFFASCPSFCRDMNRAVASLAEEYAGDGVKFVSITVDPEHDTPEQLREYAQGLGADPANWLFLTGDLADAQELGQGVFKVTVQGKVHSDRLVLVDRQGKVRGAYSFQDPKQLAALERQLRELIDKPS